MQGKKKGGGLFFTPVLVLLKNYFDTAFSKIFFVINFFIFLDFFIFKDIKISVRSKTDVFSCSLCIRLTNALRLRIFFLTFSQRGFDYFGDTSLYHSKSL